MLVLILLISFFMLLLKSKIATTRARAHAHTPRSESERTQEHTHAHTRTHACTNTHIGTHARTHACARRHAHILKLTNIETWHEIINAQGTSWRQYSTSRTTGVSGCPIINFHYFTQASFWSITPVKKMVYNKKLLLSEDLIVE